MTSEVENLRSYLSRQEENPILHINGNDHSNALLAVDFGQPTKGVHLSVERHHELTNLMKAAAKTLTRRRGSIRVHYDNHHGVFWASTAT